MFSFRIGYMIVEYVDPSSDSDAYDVNSARTFFPFRVVVARAYLIMFAVQSAMLSARVLVYFQTSEFFGLLGRTIQKLVVALV